MNLFLLLFLSASLNLGHAGGDHRFDMDRHADSLCEEHKENKVNCSNYGSHSNNFHNKTNARKRKYFSTEVCTIDRLGTIGSHKDKTTFTVVIPKPFMSCPAYQATLDDYSRRMKQLDGRRNLKIQVVDFKSPESSQVCSAFGDRTFVRPPWQVLAVAAENCAHIKMSPQTLARAKQLNDEVKAWQDQRITSPASLDGGEMQNSPAN